MSFLRFSDNTTIINGNIFIFKELKNKTKAIKHYFDRHWNREEMWVIKFATYLSRVL